MAARVGDLLPYANPVADAALVPPAYPYSVGAALRNKMWVDEAGEQQKSPDKI